MPAIVTRAAPPEVVGQLLAEGAHPVLARVYAARGVRSLSELDTGLEQLAPPGAMLNLAAAARWLADAIAARRRLAIVADYDADGATACAVGLRALRACGALVDFLVPNRFEFGYGLTPEIVRLARARLRPDVLITVDNGITSFEGVAEANRLGMEVLITDHHLPAERLPPAACIVNPNQPGCAFPSKHLAGVGVMFYLMLALRAELRQRGAFGPSRKTGSEGRKESGLAAGFRAPSSAREDREPNLAELLPLVALGTVADVVALDRNNRILVAQGLARIRAGRMPPGIAALFRAAGRDPACASTYDLGFVLGPRLNAAGRLTDMALGIECLATDDEARAAAIAAQLDRLNRERREIQSGMHQEALAAIESRDYGESYTLSLYDPSWHPGVVGILAGRMRERLHRPAIAFARGAPGEIRGSGRSIPALHLRDALDRVAARHPGLILKFGGHAAAAGLTLREADFERFRDAFEETARSLLTPADLERVIETDGALAACEATLEIARQIEDGVWGQGFPRPSFEGRFEVRAQRVVGERHLRLRLAAPEREFEAMLFGETGPLPPEIEAVYRLAVSEFQGLRGLRLEIEHWRPA
ncbi:MAG TPA: single-stranded-DNA-specific exonuclease RecJ [Burkholderiales bacterium]|nr:single-stranded-DNA-specific exonuclease RecJ [Burkholderiales bacterium]